MNSDSLKQIVKDKYGEIAATGTKIVPQENCGCCGDDTNINFSDDYTQLDGYNPDADLGLGCGVPTEFAAISEGDHVLDLGSGAGNDCFVVRSIVGEKGRITGLDFTDEMLAKARKNVDKLGYTNIDFVKGDIENIPLPDNTYDVVISNCVLNLVPDKASAFAGIYRVLKPGGHFCISDIVLRGTLPPDVKEQAILYAGCVAGAQTREDYLANIANQKFTNVTVVKEREIVLPDEFLKKYLNAADFAAFKKSGAGVYSITVTADK
jgi:arsenite methyltransferase